MTLPKSALEARAIREVTRLCLAGLDPVTLRAEVTHAMRKAVPCEGYCSFETDPATGLMMNADHPDERRGRFFLQHVYLDSEFELHAWMRKNRCFAMQDWARSTRAEKAPFPIPSGLDAYTHFLTQLGVSGHLAVIFMAGDEMWGGLSLLRDGSAASFSEREISLLCRLAPHIGAGLKSSMLRETATARQPTEGAPGVLVIDRRGLVVEHTPAIEQWLSELAVLEPGWRDQGNLPDAVCLLMAALRRSLSAETEADRTAQPTLRVRGRSGCWLNLRASLSEASGDRAGDVIVVLGPAGPQELVWLRTSQYGLTAREQSVVELVMRGISTKEIADSLSISEYTVQHHLSHVFEKVGVRSRRALVNRLYLDGRNH